MLQFRIMQIIAIFLWLISTAKDSGVKRIWYNIKSASSHNVYKYVWNGLRAQFVVTML
jgi:hypothetical protein